MRLSDKWLQPLAAILICAWPTLALAEEVLPPASQRYAQISGNATPDIPDFQRHVVPLLGRLGCNGRACHGSFQGRGGFQLSLFGYDFQMDHAALTQKSESEPGLRIDRRAPQQSLILRKPSEQISHEGGQRFTPDSWEHHLLRQWVSGGAQGAKAPRALESLHVEPSELRFDRVGEKVSLRVTAVWADGTREDVTCLCRFRSNDDSVAEVDLEGSVQAIGAGDTHVIAFYDNGVSSAPVIVPAARQGAAVAWPRDPRTTPIDQLVNARLRKLGIVPSSLCSDGEFLRRLSIDLTGTLPTAEEVVQFLNDASLDKRDRKIDELLERPTFAAWWATKLCDFTGCSPDQQAELGQELAEQWYMWMYQRIREGTPYDDIVARIMLATSRQREESYDQFAAQTSGYFREESPADFSARETMPHYWSRRTLAKPEDKAMAVAHSFLGLRLQCAQCHKHPWDQWTQQDFNEFSKLFSNVRFGVAPDARERYGELANQVGLQVRGNEGAAVRPEVLAKAQEGRTIPWREVYIEPRSGDVTLNLLRSGQITLARNDDPRAAVLEWMRDPRNPWFSRALVNRVWASCFHAGIVDPPDDFNAANPASNSELLDWLADGFVENGFDLKWLLRQIAQSSTWQRSCRPNETNVDDHRHFSRMIPRRLPAEVLYDGMKQVLAASDNQDHVRTDLTRRAVGHLSMRMAGTYAMHVFGKPERAVTCDCERVNEPSLLQAVFMQNDPLVQMQLAESGWIAEIADADSPSALHERKWIETAWLRALGRPPAPEEVERAHSHIRAADSREEGMTDLLWSLLNTKEFLLNH